LFFMEKTDDKIKYVNLILNGDFSFNCFLAK